MEELDEYCAAETNEDAVEELADILEIIYALSVHHGALISDLEAVRQDKTEKSGGFKEKILLINLEESV